MGRSGGAVDVLVVGAGPTGLALAAQAHRHGASVRIVDRAPDQVHESRALAVQPRTLEVLRGTGVSDRLVARGNDGIRLVLHGARRTARLPLFDAGVDDTAYPFVLFVSQAETESALADHLAVLGVRVERGVELTRLEQHGDVVRAGLDGRDGRADALARFVVGCDGSRSTVRQLAGIPFRGKAYPQAFVLADVEVDGPLEQGAVHTWFTSMGLMFLFPLGSPATWRLITTRGRPEEAPTEPVGLEGLQRSVDQVTGSTLRLRDPVWLSDFRVSCRQAARYRAGRVLLAGDAAHVHSPAGGQGMNTGIQDAWNLGWKLALVARGIAPDSLLDSYESERLPVGRDVLRLTDRLFTVATSPRVAWARTRVVPRVAPLVMRLPVRSAGFRRVGQLSVGYRGSPAVAPPERRRGLGPGDRLPDAPVTVAGMRTRLHDLVGGPGFHVLVLGDSSAPRANRAYVSVHWVARPPRALARADRYVVVRPDGYVGALTARAAGVEQYLTRFGS
ncbi:MAG TPA: FAD-dependent monooxygenase [Jiangellales bacterium]|nr:FAD-dependent monooxygenase [Jiangellales bacterium]